MRSTWLQRLRATLGRVASMTREKELSERLDAEVAFHIDMQTQRNVERGMSPDDARNEARRAFGGRDRWREAARDESRSRPLAELSGDVRMSARVIRRHPGFAAATALTMAIGIAATTSIFSVADAFLFRELPFPEGDRLVMIGDVQGSDSWTPAAYLEFTDWKQRAHEADPIVASFHSGMTYVSTDVVDRLRVGRVSAGYFDLLGVRPIAGRLLSAADHLDGAAPVAVVSVPFWRQRLGERRDAVGGQITLNGQSYTIVGVADGALELSTDRTAAWIPLENTTPWKDRGTHYLTVLGKLRPGATLATLQRELDDVGRRVREANQTGHFIIAGGLRERMVGAGRTPLLLLLASVGLLLCISIANVAGLLQARTAGRATEIAVRTALGASRWRIMRQVVTESVALALLGAGIGVLLSIWVLKGFVWLWPVTIPRPVDIGLDGRAVAMSLLLSIAGAIAASALTALVRHPQVSLSDRATGGFGTPQRVRRMLVAGQVAITVVLLVGAGLTMRSLARLLSTDIGFSTERVLTARISLPAVRYREGAAQRAFFGTLIERLRALPGVEDASAVLNLPLTGASMSGDFAIQGRPPFSRDSAPSSEKSIVTPGYFSTMRIRLIRGRVFDARDAAIAPQVAVINESMAKRFWPEGDAIGARLQVLGDSTTWQEIVGVVADARVEAIESQQGLVAYVPFDQHPSPGMALTIRTATPEPVTNALRQIVRELEPTVAVFGVQPYEKIVFNATHKRRVPAVLLATFAGLALLLASVGLYGLLAYAVEQRKHEMGVRMAVGANSGDVLRLVLGEGMRLVATGAVLGALAALYLSRLIASLLYGITASDPVVYSVAVAAVGVVALAACAVPAFRASRVDPATVLRSE